MWTAMTNFSYLPLELNAVIAYLARASFWTDRRTEEIYTVETFEGKTYTHFLQRAVLGVNVVIAKIPLNYSLNGSVSQTWDR